MKNLLPLQPGVYYHIFNRGNNRENLFNENQNYLYFLQLYSSHIHPIADTFAYCLLPNHFHFLLRIKTTEEISISKSKNQHEFRPSQNFSNFFNGYTKAFNKIYQRSGSLFQDRFGRIPITSETHFIQLVFYIHFNPQKHGLVNDFRKWTWSSYQALCGNQPSKLARDEVIRWFGSVEQFENFHRSKVDDSAIRDFIGDE